MLKSLASRVSFWHRALFHFGSAPRDASRPEAGTHAMTTVLDLPLDPTSSEAARRPRGPRPLSLVCRLCGAPQPAAASATCEECLGPLEPVYDAGRTLPDAATIAARAPSLWRYREWLPFEGEPVVSLDSGFTPLLDAPALARRLGVARVWVKNDAVCHPVAQLQGPGRRVGPQRRARRSASTRWAAPRPATWPTRSRRRPPAPASRPGSSSPTISSSARSSAPRCTARTWCGCAAPTTT